MTEATQPQLNQTQENKPNDKEYNFRALEAKFQRQLDQERQERERLQRELQEKSKPVIQEEETDDEPYVDHKRLEKKLSSFERKLEEKIEKKAEEKARRMLDEEKKNSWLKNNPDFYDVLQHAEKFAQQDPELAETILEMPEGFERQKLVYKNIKALGIHKPEEKKSTIQEKVDANRRSPYYQPSGVGTAPYNNHSDYSPAGQKAAFEKMQQLKKQLRI